MKLASQNCIECPILVPNDDLTINDPTITNGNNSFLNNVNDWRPTYNTPHHLMYNENVSPYCSQNWAGSTWGTIVNCIAATEGGTNNEGIHTSNFSFIRNQFISYCISADYERLSCTGSSSPSLNSRLVFRASTNLPSEGASPLSPNHGTNFQILRIEEVNDYDVHHVEIGYNPFVQEQNPDLDYEQFQIFQCQANGFSPISLSNIEIICNTTALTSFTSTTGMPNNCGLTHNFTPTLNHNGCSKDEKYEWRVRGLNNDAIFSTTENASFTFPSAGSYDVCLKYTDCYGCCAEVCQRIEVIECGCVPKQGFTEINANGGINISNFFGNTNLLIGVRLFVRGNLIINQNTTFNNSIIEMAPNARITVRPEVRFFIENNCIVQAGCDEMWEGIFYSGPGAYRVLNSLIRDAQNALSISGAARLTLTGNSFERNYRCINVTRALNPFKGLSGNTFDGILPVIGPVPIYTNYGIYGNDVGVLNINAILASNTQSATGQNTFYGFSFAVSLERYNQFYCNNNLFLNMKSEGSTIKLVNQNTLGTSRIMGNTFDRGHQAIEALRCNGEIQIKTNMFYNHLYETNTLVGKNILIKNCQNLVLLIDAQNSFNTSTIALQIDNIRGGQVNIRNNTFNSCELNNLVQNILPICRIQSNIYNSYTREAINVFGLSQVEITNNVIHSNFEDGILVRDCPNAKIIENTVNNANQFALVISRCENFDVQCNTLNLCNMGLNITSTLMGGKLQTNEMNNITTQSLILNNCAIGTQDKHGNLFSSANSVGHLINSDVNDNRFLYNNSTPPAGRSWFPITQSGVPAGQTWFESNTFGSNLVCSTPPQASTSPLTNQLANAINGNVLNNIYYDQNVWSSQWFVMHTLRNNPALMNGNTTLTNFYNTSSVIKSYYDMNKNIDELYNFTPSELVTLNGYELSLNTKLSELDAIQALVTDQNYTQYSAPLDAKHVEIMVLIDAIKPILITAENRAISNAQILKTAVASLPEPKYFCDEYKVIYNARLDAILYGENYSKNQHGSALIDVASKCHIDFGFAVYSAMALCNQYGLTYNYSNCIGTQPRSYNNITDERINEITIYPNPTSNRLVIDSKIPIKNFVLIDINGRQIKNETIKDEFSHHLDVSMLKNGVYFIKVEDESGKTHVKKVFKL